MSSLYLDTHSAVFLHAGEVELFGTEGKRQIEANDLLIAPIVLMELGYLYERERVRFKPAEIYAALNAQFGVALCLIPYADVAYRALDLTWTRDPFDRLIVAHAQAAQNAPLLTRDRMIRLHYPQAIW